MSTCIERMRQESAPKTAPTLHQLQGICTGLLRCQSLSDIAHDTGLDQRRVKELVAEFGSRLAMALGPAEGTLSSVHTIGQMVLFQDIAPQQDPIVIPDGFEANASSDLRRAAAAIIFHRPGDDQMTLFLNHRYGPQYTLVTNQDLHTVHRFAQLDRLDDLDEIDPARGRLTRALVEAFDMLEQGLGQAHATFARLQQIAAQNREGHLVDPHQALEATQQLRWVAEAELAKLQRFAEAAGATPDAYGLLERELRSWHQRSHSWQPPRTIGELSVAQVTRLATSCGLDETQDAKAKAAIGRELLNRGLRSERAQLLPAGLWASRNGKLDQFWAALDARAAGDTTWCDQLRALGTQSPDANAA